MPLKRTLTAIALALSCAAGAAAQQAQEEECILLPIVWRGNAEELRAIRERPVPESYLHYFKQGGCTSFQFVEESLIRWHVAFGDEATTTAALQFFDAEYAEGLPATDVASTLRREFSRADRAQRDDPTSARAAELRRRRDRLLQAPGSYAWLAQLYLNAAEFYESPGLYERGAAYVRHAATAMPEVERRLGPAERTNFGSNVIDYPGVRLRAEQLRKLERQAAVLEARITRDPDDIDAASAMVQELYRPEFGDAAAYAMNHFDSFCVLEGDPEYAALGAACKADPDFDENLQLYWSHQAHLDLLMAVDTAHYAPRAERSRETGSAFARRAAEPASEADARDRFLSDESFFAAMTLVRYFFVRAYGGGEEEQLTYDRGGDEVVALRLARADMLIRAASNDAFGIEELPYAMGELAAAERIARPFETPGRWRQIAAKFFRAVALYRDALGGEAALRADVLRLEAYFQATHAALDAIVAAAPR